MLGFVLRLAARTAVSQRYRFAALVSTIALASSLLVVLSGLYLNASSFLAVELSGVPNLVVEPKRSIVQVGELNTTHVLALKSERHFWRNNILNAVPVQLAEGSVDGKRVKVAGVWFRRDVQTQNGSFPVGLLEFRGWRYSGEPPGEGSAVAGAALQVKPGEVLVLRVGNSSMRLRVAGVIETGSYWDRYLFVSLDALQRATGRRDLDMILVGALIKPKDELALKAELYGTEALSPEEFEAWYCSPYASAIAYTIEEVVPQGSVRVLRRVTEVQEELIRASSGAFLALFAASAVVALLSVLSALRMYTAAKRTELGVLRALGASEGKISAQLGVEVLLASLAAGLLAYPLSRWAASAISGAVFGVELSVQRELLLLSTSMPPAAALVALVLLRRELRQEVAEVLR